MTKFHINKHGSPAPCKAEKGGCPYGGNDHHFGSHEEAQEYADKLNEDRYGIMKSIDPSKAKLTIPKGTPKQLLIGRADLEEEGYRLEKATEGWAYLDKEGNIVGYMHEPTVIYDNRKRMIEVVDLDDYRTSVSVQGLKALRLLSNLNLVSEDVINTASHIEFFTPQQDMSEYNEAINMKRIKNEENGLRMLKERINTMGANKTSDLFRTNNNDKISNYFSQLETKETFDKHKYTSPKPVSYDPNKDNWEDLPSAKDFTIQSWQENNLDLQMINNKWAVINSDGDIVGTLNEPVVAVNFEGETIEAIGEYDKINKICEEASSIDELKSGEPRHIDKLGLVKFDGKNKDLSKIRELFRYAWAFRERNAN